MSYLRQNIESMSPYVPGEQPRTEGLVKLNTNENPYPPSPRVTEALSSVAGGRLRLYPDPTAEALREKLAGLHGFDPAQVIVGNGCDDILNLCVRAFCGEGEPLAYFWPSYSLYPVLADIQGARQVVLPLGDDYQVQAHPSELRRLEDVKLVFITQPNAPSGVWIQRAPIQRVIEATPGVVVIDEAYVEFAAENCLDFAREYPNVIVARSFSKSYSLAGIRLGWGAGARELTAGLMKVKDSYNVNRLSQVAGEAALDDRAYFVENLAKIRATRQRLSTALADLGFQVHPSQANFVFAKPPRSTTVRDWFEALRRRNILVRWWDADRVGEFARVSIGTDDQIDQLLAVTREIL